MLSISQLRAQRLMTSLIKSRIEYLIPTYTSFVLLHAHTWLKYSQHTHVSWRSTRSGLSCASERL